MSTGQPNTETAAQRRFEGKVAFVTGAGMGIGEAVAKRLAAEGASVAVVDFNRDSAERVAAGLDRALALEVDVRDAQAVSAAVERTVSEFGGLDAVMSIAGLARYGTADELSEDDWDAVMDTNAKGPFLVAKYAIPHLRQRGGGSIINMASVQAFGSQQTVCAYAASKGAVVSMTKTLALDHAHDQIRVNCICPGSVETPMLHQSADTFHAGADKSKIFAEWGRLHPLGRVIQPAEVAALACFLASDEAAAITGAPYLIDGGLTAKLAVEG